MVRDRYGNNDSRRSSDSDRGGRERGNYRDDFEGNRNRDSRKGNGDRGSERRGSDRYDSRGRGGYNNRGFNGGGRSGGGRNYGGRGYGGGRGYDDNRRGGNRRGGDFDSENNGNGRERIAVESGSLVFIDQYMLANADFVTKYSKIIDESPETKTKLLEEFGGKTVEIEPGTYRIDRNPYDYSILIYPEYEQIKTNEFKRLDITEVGVVLIDTRCIAMIDKELLDDSALLKKYQQLWEDGQDKACRDLLRDNGGAVRYGFSRDSDDLLIFVSSDKNAVGLWPTNIDELLNASEEYEDVNDDGQDDDANQDDDADDDTSSSFIAESDAEI